MINKHNKITEQLEKKKKEQYRETMIEVSKDKQYIQDMQEIENDFK